MKENTNVIQRSVANTTGERVASQEVKKKRELKPRTKAIKARLKRLEEATLTVQDMQSQFII
jgi:hypothetical protein